MNSSKIVAITLYRRPELTTKLFAGLVKCYGFENYEVIISCDHSAEHRDACREVQGIARKFLREYGYGELHIHEPRLGIDRNKLWVLPVAFARSAYVIFLEDDTPIAEDGLRYFEAMGAWFADQPDCMSVSGYNRYCEAETHERVLSSESYAIDRGNGFSAWGWATWKDRYASVVGEDGGKYLEFCRGANSDGNGLFDHWWREWMKRERERERSGFGPYTVYPVMPRSNHVGWVDAEHTVSEEWLMKHEFAPFGAWSQPLPDPKPEWWRLKFEA